jgi:hypothetical protein
MHPRQGRLLLTLGAQLVGVYKINERSTKGLEQVAADARVHQKTKG